MNISGVTNTVPVLPQSMGAEVSQATDVAATSGVGADAVAFDMQVATSVMDMAQSQFEDAANQLISTMAAATGVGQNVDAMA